MLLTLQKIKKAMDEAAVPVPEYFYFADDNGDIQCARKVKGRFKNGKWVPGYYKVDKRV